MSWWEALWEKVLAGLLDQGAKVVLVIVLAVLVRWLLQRAIDRVVRGLTARRDGRDGRDGPPGGDGRGAMTGRAGTALAKVSGLATERHRQRMETLASLLRSVVTVTVLTLTALTLMSIFGVPLGPILASAGVGGVALGFGAQSLVRDFLSGVFMIMEDQYGVGDTIDSGQATGVVEEVTLRVTRLRDAQGVIWYVRNGEILRVGNKSQGTAVVTLDVPVPYSEDVDKVVGVIRAATTGLQDEAEWSQRVMSEPRVLGVESIANGIVTIRVVAEAVPGEQFALSRDLRERIKKALDAAGVKAAPPTFPGFGPVKPPGTS